MSTRIDDRPLAIDSLSESQIVDLDVRPILADGGEPFSDIIRAVGSLPERGALRLRAPFKPTPLFGVLRARGLKHWVEYGAGEDWLIWFYR